MTKVLFLDDRIIKHLDKETRMVLNHIATKNRVKINVYSFGKWSTADIFQSGLECSTDFPTEDHLFIKDGHEIVDHAPDEGKWAILSHEWLPQDPDYKSHHLGFDYKNVYFAHNHAKRLAFLLGISHGPLTQLLDRRVYKSINTPPNIARSLKEDWETVTNAITTLKNLFFR